MNENKGIIIKNIYYMLTYAFQILRQNQYEELAVEEFEHIHDLLAAILVKGISGQLKQGLYKEYKTQEDMMTTMRGKINMTETIRNRMQTKQTLYCCYDELSEDNLYNRILKSTCKLLLCQDTVAKERKIQLKRVLFLFSTVQEIELKAILWSRIRYEKGNQTYQMLLHICHMVIDGMLLTTTKGEYTLASFLDEQKMCRLYEKFILEYYKYHHPEYHAHAAQIAWTLEHGAKEFLPIMQTDITLNYKGNYLIIDAKYYTHTMQEQFDSYKIHSQNLYQIFTYVKNMDKQNTGKVAGMLLYAKTKEQITPDADFSMDGNQISVKTLDLNQDFEKIKKKLEEIGKMLYFI